MGTPSGPESLHVLRFPAPAFRTCLVISSPSRSTTGFSTLILVAMALTDRAASTSAVGRNVRLQQVGPASPVPQPSPALPIASRGPLNISMRARDEHGSAAWKKRPLPADASLPVHLPCGCPSRAEGRA